MSKEKKSIFGNLFKGSKGCGYGVEVIEVNDDNLKDSKDIKEEK